MAQAQAQAQVQAQALLNNMEFRNKNLSKLVTFYAEDKKDTMNPKDWIMRVMQAKEAAHWVDEDAINNVGLLMAGDAKIWFDALKLNENYQATWEYLVNEFKRAFVPSLTRRSIARLSENLKQRHDEPVRKFYDRIRTTLDDFRTLLPARNLDLDGLEQGIDDAERQRSLNYAAVQIRKDRCFVTRIRTLCCLENGLLPDYFEYLMTQVYDDNPDVAIQKLEDYEKAKKHEKKITKIAEVQEDEESSVAKESTPEDMLESKIEAVFTKFFNKNQGKFNGNNSNNSNYKKSGNSDSRSSDKPRTCYYCGKPGHSQIQCNKRKANNMPCIGKDKVPYFPPGEKNPFENKKKDFQ